MGEIVELTLFSPSKILKKQCEIMVWGAFISELPASKILTENHPNTIGDIILSLQIFLSCVGPL